MYISTVVHSLVFGLECKEDLMNLLPAVIRRVIGIFNSVVKKISTVWLGIKVRIMLVASRSFPQRSGSL